MDGKWMNCIKMEYGKMEQPTLSKARRGTYIVSIVADPWALMGFPWTIPPNDFPEPENNWANTYATTYQVPAENKLQRKTYDIGSFIKWFCRRKGKKKLCKTDLEGPAFNLVKAFHKNNVFLLYQMDECHNGGLITQWMRLNDQRKDSFIVSKKRSSDSSKKLKGIQTLTPAEQEAADIMKALKESKKMSKRQPGTGGSNEGTGNILGVPDESTVISRASSEGTGSKPGVPDEEKLIL
ncbi:hypothetical protein Tco_0745468 [Tanacetum coccineum]